MVLEPHCKQHQNPLFHEFLNVTNFDKCSTINAVRLYPSVITIPRSRPSGIKLLRTLGRTMRECSPVLSRTVGIWFPPLL